MPAISDHAFLSKMPSFQSNAAQLIERIEALLRPETPLERALLQQPAMREGMVWGEPRFGHPEGQVVFHVQEVFENIDRLPARFGAFREKLRLVALVHDSFKFQEDKSSPRDWSKHHGILARRFFEKFTSDDDLLDVVELHDEAYYCWRIFQLQKMPVEGLQSLDRLLDKIEHCRDLYFLFFRCDTMTGDKTQAPLRWIEKTVAGADFGL